MFLLYPWLRLFKCCRCLTLDDREGEEATIRKMKKKREKKKREEADKHREFQRRLEKNESIDKKLLRYLTVKVKKFDLEVNYFSKKESDYKKENNKN